MNERERIIKTDLRRLQRTWGMEDPLHEDDLRVDSGILRRLLIDGGTGLLPAYWRSLGHKGQIKVSGVEIGGQTAGLDPRMVQFASAGGATHAGVTVSGVLVYGGSMDVATIQARSERLVLPRRTTALSTYLDSTCMRIGSVSISRRTVIQFVANRLGGVHFDDDRGHPKEAIARQFAVMDGANDYGLGGQRALYFELLGIGQDLVASDAVQRILADRGP